jgi:hypothetical protein
MLICSIVIFTTIQYVECQGVALLVLLCVSVWNNFTFLIKLILSTHKIKVFFYFSEKHVTHPGFLFECVKSEQMSGMYM